MYIIYTYNTNGDRSVLVNVILMVSDDVRIYVPLTILVVVKVCHIH